MASHKRDNTQELELLHPCESNGYCVFDLALENDPLVLFHASPEKKLDSIISQGFRSAKALGTGDLDSVSYAKDSSSCITHIGRKPKEHWVILAVRFQSLDLPAIRVNPSDIHVFDPSLQPVVIGFVTIPEGLHWR